MFLKCELDGRELEFQVIFSKRKSLVITIEPPDLIKVKAPKGLSRKIIMETVMSKSQWIYETIDKIKEMGIIKTEKMFQQEEKFLFLGKEYKLNIEQNANTKNCEINLDKNKMLIKTPVIQKEYLKKHAEKWYRMQAIKIIENRISYFGEYFSCLPLAIKVKEQKKRWGSCTYDNRLLFNWRIVMASPEALDYVVVHEMCHMIEKNHSKNYWRLVERILPDYKKSHQWLVENGFKMNL